MNREKNLPNPEARHEALLAQTPSYITATLQQYPEFFFYCREYEGCYHPDHFTRLVKQQMDALRHTDPQRFAVELLTRLGAQRRERVKSLRLRFHHLYPDAVEKYVYEALEKATLLPAYPAERGEKYASQQFDSNRHESLFIGLVGSVVTAAEMLNASSEVELPSSYQAYLQADYVHAYAAWQALTQSAPESAAVGVVVPWVYVQQKVQAHLDRMSRDLKTQKDVSLRFID